jgi:predicted acylesterase/phospholipase RssA
MPTRSHQAAGRRLGLCLSGGGNRATLFGIGVVVALTDVGAHRRVHTVSSVSGGSVLNAVLGSSSPWPTSSAKEVRARLKPLAAMIAHTGFSAPGTVSFATSSLLVSLVAGGVWTALATARSGALPLWSGAVVVGAVVGTVTGLWIMHVGRQHIALQPYNNLVLGRETKLTSLHNDTIRHVVCATDLETARHFFFSGECLESEAWGRGSSGDMLLSFAVECSAAFPLVFPVKTLLTKYLNFDPGRQVPATLKLADGGVHDNLGLSGLCRTDDAAYDQGDVIVVNASWDRPYRRLDRFKTARVFAVMHQSNWSYRAQKTEDEFIATAVENGSGTGALVSIGEPPAALLQRVALRCRDENGQVSGPIVHRIAAAREYLDSIKFGKSGEKYGDDQLEILCRSAAGTKTTLGKVGVDCALDILEHGYISSAVACHVLLATDLPPPDGHRDLRTLLQECRGMRLRSYLPFQTAVSK